MTKHLDHVTFRAAQAPLQTHRSALLCRQPNMTPHIDAAKIYIVGAGPGDPDLLTMKAMRVLQAADVVVYDKLVGRAILDYARADADLIFVGKTRSNHSVPQEEICSLLVSKAQDGHSVVRLKGGDPFIFGRGGEELQAARAAHIEVEIIPGITAALGCAAQAQIPLTHRDHASAVTFVAGQCRDLATQDWRGLTGQGRTLVIYMGLNGASDIAAKLISDGLATDTPVAVIENGTRRNVRVLQTTLADLTETVQRHGFSSPSLLIIGDVATFAQTNVTETYIQDLLMKAEA
jgi:uroporphyrin-III C-methyltransferase